MRNASPVQAQKSITALTRFFFASTALLAIFFQAPALGEEEAGEKPGWELHGYGTVNYYMYKWQTDPTRRAEMDLERLAVEPDYRVNDWLGFEAEIEFEHGGTGATMEFDKVEESGEFETEVEKGGEVTVEELCASIRLHPALTIRIGHFFLPIGWAFAQDEPGDYFTVRRSETESALLPVLWHETGIAIEGKIGPLAYEAQLVNGLDATGFSSANWIAGGHQGRFEMVNAENLAWVGRLDYQPIQGVLIGASGYYGNSADNRPKPDLKVPAHVSIGDVHGQVRRGPFIVRGLFLLGRLQNAGAVSLANRNLSSNLNVKRTPVGSEAAGGFVEAGVDVLALADRLYGFRSETTRKQRVDVFSRYETYDTMRKTDPGYFNNPRWERKVWSGGINYAPDPHLILKSQFSRRTVGLAVNNREDAYSLGLGLMF